MTEVKSYTLYGGLGDHVVWLGLLSHLPEPKVIICDPRMEKLANLYEGRSFRSLIVSHIRPHDSFLCWHHHHVGLEWQYLRNRDGTIATIVREILKLPPKAKITSPEWPEFAELSSSFRLFIHELMPRRTVLLAPYAHSISSHLSLDWWIDCVKWIKSKGWSVATNVANRGRGYDQVSKESLLEAIPGTVPVDVALNEIGTFAKQCGAVLCSRSGLSDLLARVNTNMCVVWPIDIVRKVPDNKDLSIWSIRSIYDSKAKEVKVSCGTRFYPEQLGDWLDEK